MGGFVTRWPLVVNQRVTDADLDDDGAVTDEAVGRWVEQASRGHLDRCAPVRQAVTASGLELRPRPAPPPGSGRLLGQPDTVVVGAAVSEIRSTSLDMSIRLRPLGGDRDTPLDLTQTVDLVDRASGHPLPVTDAMRDELIALAHGARHLN